jgi:hypothetical protein
MAPKKEQVFGGIGGIICIAAIVLAIVFGILWGQQRDKRKTNADKVSCLNLCNSQFQDKHPSCPGNGTSEQWCTANTTLVSCNATCNREPLTQ